MPDGDPLVLGKVNSAASYTLMIGGGLGVTSPTGWDAIKGSGGKVNGVWGDHAGEGHGVLGTSTNGRGVAGTSWTQVGVFGHSQLGAGVRGSAHAEESIGVQGDSPFGIGVQGVGGIFGVGGFAEGRGIGVVGANPAGTAGFFWGKLIASQMIVGGPKQAAVPHPDGRHRLLYAMESPECWFEDFGTSRLRGGRAKLKLRPDFASLVRTTDEYHVFLTPEGDCNGLYLGRKSRTGFEVRELRGGKSSIRFSYRIVARRKDIAAPRLPKLRIPELLEPPQAQQPPKTPHPLDLMKSRKRSSRRR